LNRICGTLLQIDSTGFYCGSPHPAVENSGNFADACGSGNRKAPDRWRRLYSVGNKACLR